MDMNSLMFDFEDRTNELSSQRIIDINIQRSNVATPFKSMNKIKNSEKFIS